VVIVSPFFEDLAVCDPPLRLHKRTHAARNLTVLEHMVGRVCVERGLKVDPRGLANAGFDICGANSGGWVTKEVAGR